MDARPSRTGQLSHFGTIQSRIEKAVRRAVYRRLSAHEDREDVMQEIFLQVFIRIGTLRDPRALELWSTRIAFNMVSAHIRRRRRKTLDECVSSRIPDAFYEPDREGWSSALRALSILERLPARERNLLSRWLFTPVPWLELAADSACSEATVKRRLKRARTRFERLASQDPNLAPRLANQRRLGHASPLAGPSGVLADNAR